MAKAAKDIELKVGIFISVGLGLIMLAILMLGGASSFFTKTHQFHSRFTDIEGLIAGAKVLVSGVRVGVVESVDIDPQKLDIRVSYTVEDKYVSLIRTNSVAQIATQGVLGDKYIALTAGSPDAAALPADSEIPNAPSNNINQILSSSEHLVQSLQSITGTLDRILKSFESNHRADNFFKEMAETAKNMSAATKSLNEQVHDMRLKSAINTLDSILKKIDRGDGTIGALINDPELYNDAKSLVGGTSRNRIMRNLIRKTIKDGESTPAGAEEAKQN